MANSYVIGPAVCTGYDPGAGYSPFSGKVLLTETVNTSSNSSSIAWSFVIYINHSQYISNYSYSNYNKVTVVINGQTLVSTGNIGVVAMHDHYETGNPGPLVLCSGSIDVPHGADGTKTLVVSANYTQNNSAYMQTIAVNGSVELQSITRADRINSCPDFTLSYDMSVANPAGGTTNHTVTWTNSSNFYHKIEYLYGTNIIYTSNVINPNTTQHTYAFKAADASYVIDAKKMKVTVALHSYSDSTCTNELGVSSKDITITFDSSFGPLTYASILLGDLLSNEVVAGYSTATINCGGSFKADAELKEAHAVYLDGTKALGGAVYGTTSISLGKIPAFDDVSKSLKIKYVITDTRGFSVTNTANLGTVYGWSAPSVSNVSAWRCKSNGTEDLRGGYYKVKFTYSIRPLNNKNAKVAAVSYKYLSSSTWSNPISGNVSNYSDTLTLGPYTLSQARDEKLEVRVAISDTLSSGNASIGTAMILPAVVFVDIKTDGDEKVGLGIGTISTTNKKVQFGWDIQMKDENSVVRTELDPETGLTFYDANGIASGNYPPNGSGGSGGGSGGNGFTYAFKMALLNCFSNVAWINQDGRTYYNALVNAINDPYPANVTSVSAVFSQGSAVIYAGSNIDDLRQYLTVTAHFSDNTSRTVTDYLLTGVLTAGTSTITVLYGGQTTTFNVSVTASVVYDGSVTLSQSNTPNVISSSAITYDTTKIYSIQYTFGTISTSGASTTPNCIVGPANSSNAVRGGAMFWSAANNAWQVQTGGSATTISPAPANGDLVTVVLNFTTNKLSVYVNNTAAITDATLSRDYFTNTARLIAGRENANMTVAPNHIIVSIGDIH